MKKFELIKAMAEKTGLSQKDCDAALSAFAEVVVTEVRDNEDAIAIPNLGTFKVKKVKEHDGRNPMTGETIHVPASKTIQFKAQSTLKV